MWNYLFDSANDFILCDLSDIVFDCKKTWGHIEMLQLFGHQHFYAIGYACFSFPLLVQLSKDETWYNEVVYGEWSDKWFPLARSENFQRIVDLHNDIMFFFNFFNYIYFCFFTNYCCDLLKRSCE